MYPSTSNLIYLSQIWTPLTIFVVQKFTDTCRQDNVDGLKVDPASIERYRNYVQATLPTISDVIQDCSDPDCKSHLLAIDSICDKLFSCLYCAGQQCLPQFSKHAKVLPGWNDSVRPLHNAALFWNRLWSENDCPSSGVLLQERKQSSIMSML